jgi:RHS repeat-associated protein
MANDAPSNGNTGSESGEATSRVIPPHISLPKGGGAIRGIDEKFTANPTTGTGSLNIPLALSPGRAGFGPQLALSYDSGSGNGIFGVGWTLSMPSITRRTDKGLPSYHDAAESDIFVLSGAEDLVPVLLCDGSDGTQFDEFERDGFRIKRYRPRIESLFARIERWTQCKTGETHWRSLSKDNILTVYGLDAGSRISDPEAPEHVFSWLICRSYDDKGNAIVYDYAAENDHNVDLTKPSERRRNREANRYPKLIRYGNRLPVLFDPERPSFRRCHIEPHDLDRTHWLFEVVFDYGENHYCEEASAEPERKLARASEAAETNWLGRRDPFSSYRSGFEVRTHRLCRRVLMFHHFPDELGTGSYLSRSTAFEYTEKPIGSFLAHIVQSGHRRREDGRYVTLSLPALDVFYTQSPLENADFRDFRIETVTLKDLANLPVGIEGNGYRFLDLNGEGIPGVLAGLNEAWYYKANLGEGRFGSTETVSPLPSLAAVDTGQSQLMDLTGDGIPDLVDLNEPAPGFFERTPDAGWAGFRAFRLLPVRDWNDPNLRFVDLTGDGIPDVLITEDDAFTWHPSLLHEGFGRGRRVSVPLDEGRGPHVVFADSTESIYLADMSGDGLADLARVRNGEVCYWPNRGYGRFGAKIVMDGAPWFDEPDQFDQARIRLADTDGSGTADILYLGRDGVKVWLNHIGNGWSDVRHLRNFPLIDNVASVTAADFLGRGTACLVWSSPLPADAGQQVRYVDLMCGQKPHLLIRTMNNLGAGTRITYASSTEFYLADKAAGQPWVTRLPFPVHVVERVETYDYISRNRFVTRYTYHHGFFDGVEREFRGFGRVDQFDTETLATLTASGNFPIGTNIDASSSVPPVLTRTWFHTGVYLEGGRVARHMAHEYYQEGSPRGGEAALDYDQIRAMLLPDTILPAHLTPEEAREACRSLKGSMLRQEVYALDDKEESRRPYSVGEGNYTIRMLQQLGSNRHAVFLTHAREQATFHYERKLYDIDGRQRADPRVAHNVTLDVDDYGNVRKSVQVGYGRRFADKSPILTDEDRQKQAQILLTLSECDYTNTIDEADAWRTPLPAESRSYELIQMKPASTQVDVTNFFCFEELQAQVQAASEPHHEIPYEDAAPAGLEPDHPHRRLIERTRMLFRPNDLGLSVGDPNALLPLGKVESHALAGNAYSLALTSGLISKVYRRDGAALMPDPAYVLGSRGRDGGGYVDLDDDGHWWVPSGRVFYHPDPDATAAQELTEARAHFFMPRRFADPFGNATTVDYDPHSLLMVRTTDAVSNTATAVNDYRVLQPILLTDPNGNRAAVIFDTLGLLTGTAVMGKFSEGLGDSLVGFSADLSQRQVDLLFEANDPHTEAPSLLGNATTRIVHDVHRFARSRERHPAEPARWEPVYAATLARETHASDPLPPGGLKIQISFGYSDGLGREIQQKLQSEPGPVVDGGPVVDPRWVGSGWTIFNNKGKPVRQYEPFFSQFAVRGHRFEFGMRAGVSPILIYDPVQRVVATIHADHTLDKAIFDPWRQETWDVNDTVLITDPAVDPEIGEYVGRLPTADYLPTWYAERIGGGKGPDEKSAAVKAAKHAHTPAVTYLDSLGRTILTIADNGDGQKYTGRTVFDIKGNLCTVIDALDRVAMRFDYDMHGRKIRLMSMEAGQRWILSDVRAKSIRSWNSRQFAFRTEYDELRRPVGLFVSGGNPPPTRDILFELTVYGDSPATGLLEWEQVQNNLRGKVFRHYDGAGSVTTDLYDFKGNSLRGTRQFVRDYKNTPDWRHSPAFEAEQFLASSVYDALNRIIASTAPDGSIYRPVFNEANAIKQIDVNIRGVEAGGQPAWTSLVADIEYNAKGQRTCTRYGNGATTRYEYDDKTFLLLRLKTGRPVGRNGLTARIFNDPASVQDLAYTYDPVGNVTRVVDLALRTVFHANQKIDPRCDYTYDSIYRLIEATGRENSDQSAFRFSPPHGNFRDYPFVGAARLHDLESLRNFVEQYAYDRAGNFRTMVHVGSEGAGSWSRRYVYDEASLIEPSRKSNRLSRTETGDDATPALEPYSYDVHGNITTMQHLPVMQWNFRDQIGATSRQGVTGERTTPETTCYVYDSAGERARKVTERLGGSRKNERFYLQGFEVYREFHPDDTIALARETLHVMDDTQRIALIETKTIDDGTVAQPPVPTQRYQLVNQLGSAILELDETAALITYEEYSAFGNSTYQATKSAAEIGLKRYRHVGKERDEENGFSYYGLRYYAPWLARWTSCDPKGLIDGANLFRFCRNNPIAHIDQRGAQSKPLNPAGQVSWEIPQNVYMGSGGQRLSDAQATANFSAWIAKSHPDRPFTPGSVTIDWSSMKGRRGPTFNAEWLDSSGQPLLPRKGEFGYVAPMRQQPKAEYTDANDKSTRTTENEHATPRAQNAAIDPDYDDPAYRGDATVRSPRGVSLDKTKGDNAASKVIQDKVAAGEAVDTIETDLASHERFQDANNAAKATGQPNIRNPGSITRGTLEQMGNRFARGSGKPIPGAGLGGAARAAGSSLARAVIPGFAEAEVAGIYAHATVVGTLGITGGSLPGVAAAISAAPTTFAFAVTLPAIGGGIVGNAVESAASDAGWGKEASIGAAVIGAAATGALIGTFVPIPGVGTAAGAAIGAAIGVIGYGISKLL